MLDINGNNLVLCEGAAMTNHHLTRDRDYRGIAGVVEAPPPAARPVVLRNLSQRTWSVVPDGEEPKSVAPGQRLGVREMTIDFARAAVGYRIRRLTRLPRLTPPRSSLHPASRLTAGLADGAHPRPRPPETEQGQAGERAHVHHPGGDVVAVARVTEAGADPQRPGPVAPVALKQIEVGRRRRRRVAPVRRGHVAELLEARRGADVEQPAGEQELGEQDHRQNRERLVGVGHESGDEEAESHRGQPAQRRHQEQLQPAGRQHRAVRGTTLARRCR